MIYLAFAGDIPADKRERIKYAQIDYYNGLVRDLDNTDVPSDIWIINFGPGYPTDRKCLCEAISKTAGVGAWQTYNDDRLGLHVAFLEVEVHQHEPVDMAAFLALLPDQFEFQEVEP